MDKEKLQVTDCPLILKAEGSITGAKGLDFDIPVQGDFKI